VYAAPCVEVATPPVRAGVGSAIRVKMVSFKAAHSAPASRMARAGSDTAYEAFTYLSSSMVYELELVVVGVVLTTTVKTHASPSVMERSSIVP
jgi:hypothetical protein